MEWGKSFKRQRSHRSPQCLKQTKLHHGPSCAPNPNIVYIYIGLQKMKRKKAGSWDCHCQTLWVNTSTDCGALLSDYPHRPTCCHGFCGHTIASLPLCFQCFYAQIGVCITLKLHKANLSQHRKTERNATNLQERTNKSWKRYSSIFLFSPGLSQVVTA